MQSLAIGNGFIDPLTLQRYSHFVREVGLLDDKAADAMNHLETAVIQFINNGEMLKAYAVRRYELQQEMDQNILDKNKHKPVPKVLLIIRK